MIRNILKSVAVALAMVTLFSCENNIKVVQQISAADTLAELTATRVRYVRTDSGRRQLMLTSPLLLKYGGNKPYTEFPKGFHVYFYDTTGKVISSLRAGYGIRRERKGLLIARDSVVVKNLKTGEQLNTEKLIWDESRHRIYSPVFVKITSPDRIIFGDSMTASENFSQRTIYGIRGTLEVSEDTTDTVR
jgi:LPS export ABC transporter protein LptC